MFNGRVSTHNTERAVRARRMSISIIVPVLNEAMLVRKFLQQLRGRASKAEIIVVDGGSSDGTADLASGLCDRIVHSERGRAVQMNAGARAAHGDTFWFVHVDAEVPPQCLEGIEHALDDPRVAGGFFRIRLPKSQLVYRLTDDFAHYAGLALGVRCGDHGFFCRRNVFEAVGGFPDVPLMEDVDFFRKLRRTGKIIAMPHRMVVSPRSFESMGPFRLTFFFGVIWLFYFLGAPRSWLQAIYRRACCRS